MRGPGQTADQANAHPLPRTSSITSKDHSPNWTVRWCSMPHPGITLMRCSHDPVAICGDGRYSRFIAALKKQPGIAAQAVLLCAVDHQGIVRPGGAILVPELR